MNSEELELSLRTEFESYLKGVLADLRQDVSEFQKNFEAEFEKHKAQTDEAFRDLAKRFESNLEFDQSFNESVLEHLRLARDEGATITAAAMDEAEKLTQASAPAADFDKLRDGINEISRKTSQSEILKSLVDYAAHFTPRGAFFIVKNEQFVGWKVFGDEAAADEVTVRNIQFPLSADTVLAEAVSSLSTMTAASGGHAEDTVFLDPLEFGKPDRMYAIPLTARGRGVAVLYADYGTEGVRLNAEALETLVRVAGLTVELIAAAAAQPAPVQPEVSEQQAVQETEPVTETVAVGYADDEAISEAKFVEEEITEEHVESPVASFEEVAAQEEPEVETVEEYTGEVSFEETEVEETEVTDFVVAEPEVEEAYFEEAEIEEPVAEEPAVEETSDYSDYGVITPEETAPVETTAELAPEVEEVTYFEPVEEIEEVKESEFTESVPETEFESSSPFEAVAEPEVEVVETVSEEFEPQGGHTNGAGSQTYAEPLTEVATAQAARTRYRDRTVDLPIEVADDERRLHNDARRFARLLVSEIKLYNEQKVSDGRQSGDLYDRLREAIDRSRDMYDKRVQEPVAMRFDYFHYELVNSLAEGEDVKLGASYPGAKVLV